MIIENYDYLYKVIEWFSFQGKREILTKNKVSVYPEYEKT